MDKRNIITKRKAKGGQTTASGQGVQDPAITTQPVSTLSKLKKLPKVLGRSIEGIKPGNIIEIANTGFNVCVWQDQNVQDQNVQDQNVSKLFLEIPATTSMVNKSLAVPDQPFKWLFAETSWGKVTGWEKSPLDTILVTSNGGSDRRMGAKKTVLECLSSYQTNLKLPKRPVLKETKFDENLKGEFAITFSVKGITLIEPIMTPDRFEQSFWHSNRKFGLVKGIEPALQGLFEAFYTYQETLTAGVVNGFRIEDVAATPDLKKQQPPSNVVQARKMLGAIQDAAVSLRKVLLPVIKSTAPTAPEYGTLTELLQQVEDAYKDGFKNELGTRRWQKWFAEKPDTEKPLTEDDLVPGTKAELGSGAQGTVYQYQLDPQKGRGPAVVKYDSIGLNENAIDAGIPEENPQQSVRAVAAYKISQKLNLEIIPQTDFFVGTDDNGRPILGQAMEVVNGSVGQRKAGLKNKRLDPGLVQGLDLEMFKRQVDNPGNYTPEDVTNARNTLSGFVKVGNDWYTAENFPVDIDYNNRFVQKGLSDLQVFDYIIGHADRNAGNWIYVKQGNSIVGVIGIDNDDTFGQGWQPGTGGRGTSKTPGIPPIVDISTALSILNANFDTDILPSLGGLSPDEKDAAAGRFKQVRQLVEQRVKAGDIASMGNDAAGDQVTLNLLRQKVPDMLAQLQIKTWGPATTADHNDQNSYLGYQIAQSNTKGVAGDDGFVKPPAQPVAQPVAQPAVQLPAQPMPPLPAQPQAMPPLPAQPLAQPLDQPQ